MEMVRSLGCLHLNITPCICPSLISGAPCTCMMVMVGYMRGTLYAVLYWTLNSTVNSTSKLLTVQTDNTRTFPSKWIDSWWVRQIYGSEIDLEWICYGCVINLLEVSVFGCGGVIQSSIYIRPLKSPKRFIFWCQKTSNSVWDSLWFLG